MTTAAGDDGISAATAALAEQVRREAGQLPGPGQIRGMAEEAIRHGGAPGMTREEIRALADTAVRRAEQMTVLLRQLSAILHGDGEPGGGPGSDQGNGGGP